MRKEADVACFKLRPRIRQEELRSSEEPQSLCREDSNRALTEYNSDVLLPQSTCLIDRHEHLLEDHAYGEEYVQIYN